MNENRITAQKAMQVMEKFTGSDVTRIVDRAHKKSYRSIRKTGS